MLKKLQQRISKDSSYLSGILERIMAILVLIGIIVAIVSIKDSFITFWNHRSHDSSFLEYIDKVFSIVIGIEFFKLLWKPSKETLLEVLMFVLARHMIIEKTSSVDNLLSIVAIGILFFIEKYLLHQKNQDENPDNSE